MQGPKRRHEPDAHIGFLDEAERPAKKTPRKRFDDEPLDLDDVWSG